MLPCVWVVEQKNTGKTNYDIKIVETHDIRFSFSFFQVTHI